MAQLTAQVVSYDDDFKRQVARLLRACGVPIGIVEGRSAEGTGPDLVVVDIRADASSGMAAIERLRANNAGLAVFAIAAAAEPDLILQAMRAGANEFFPWSVAEGTPAARAMEESFHGAVRRTATRREAATAGAKPPCVTHAFLGAKGGAGTTTVAVNCAVELARLTKRPTVIVDLKTCLGEVALFLGVRPRFTVLDAIENLHRLDKDFLKELVAKHKSGLDILAGSEQFDRPNAQDAGAVEELLRVLTRAYDYVVIDGGNVINSCVAAALYAADTIFLVTNPDVPSISRKATPVEWKAGIEKAMADRFGRYEGNRIYNFAVRVDGYVLAPPVLPVVAAVRSALAALQPFTLITLDIMMPDMDGQAALSAIRSLEIAAGLTGAAGAKIFMTTALGDGKNVMAAFREQCTGYLTKPIDLEKMFIQLKAQGLIPP